LNKSSRFNRELTLLWPTFHFFTDRSTIFTASFTSPSRNYVVIRSHFVFLFERHTWYFSRSRRSFWEGDAAKRAERERIRTSSSILDEARREGKRGNCTRMNMAFWSYRFPSLYLSRFEIRPIGWFHFISLLGFTMLCFQIRDTLILIQRR